MPEMMYREIPHTGDRVSVIGMGGSMIGEKPKEEIVEVVKAAMAAGINYFDCAAGHAPLYEAYGEAFQGCRDQVMLQIHFGANYVTGAYGWTLDLEEIKASVAWQLDKLQTDYIDYGFIHCLDELDDWETYQNNGVLDYIKELKAKGVVRHIGLSTHTPAIANAVLDTGLIDVMMFSINPAYDYSNGEYAFGDRNERQELYTRCEKEGVAITVMKPYSGGQLLDAKQSPFGVALTTTKCIAYALSKPAVVTVLPGFADMDQLNDALQYLSASDLAKDFSVVGRFTPVDMKGRCVYCNHCQPCMAGINIGLVNKYYDLARMGDDMARDHYMELDVHASECILCGKCDHQCPFLVKQRDRMGEIAKYFGR